MSTTFTVGCLWWLALGLFLSFLPGSRRLYVSCVDESTCISSTPHAVIPLWNVTKGCPTFNRLPYLAASYPPDALDRLVSAGTTISFLFVQLPLENNHDDKSCTDAKRSNIKSKTTMCTNAIRTAAQMRLHRELTVRRGRPISQQIFYNQSKLFAQMTIFGIYEDVSAYDETKYYQIIKMESIYIEELSTLPGQLNMYLYQFTPPLPATYRLTMNLDFVDCQGPLQALSVQDTAAAATAAAKTTVTTTTAATTTTSTTTGKTKMTKDENKDKNNLLQKLYPPGSPSLSMSDQSALSTSKNEVVDPYQDYCQIVYYPALQFKLRVVPAKASSSSSSNTKNNQVQRRKDKGVAAFSAFTVSSSSSSSSSSSGSSMSSSSIKKLSKRCDLSDTRGSYWIYPPVPTSTKISTVLQYATPSWHHPLCPSFYARLNQMAGGVRDRLRKSLEEAKQRIHAQVLSTIQSNGQQGNTTAVDPAEILEQLNNIPDSHMHRVRFRKPLRYGENMGEMGNFSHLDVKDMSLGSSDSGNHNDNLSHSKRNSNSNSTTLYPGLENGGLTKMPLALRLRYLVHKELQTSSYYKNMSKELRDSRQQRPIVFCLAGDSNSRRTCASINRGNRIRGTNGRFMDPAMTGTIIGRCKSNVTNHHNQQILSSTKGKHTLYGLHNFSHFIANTCYQTIRGRNVKTRKYMPTIIPVVSVGHHVPDLNANELTELLVLLKRNISYIRQHAAMESLTKQEQQSGSGPLNPLTKKLFPPVFVWSNLASVVSQFDPRFPRSLHFRSNVYREAIQNHVIQRILTSPPSTGKHPSQRYRQSQPQPQSQKSSHGLALPSYYLDLFHTSMAFGQLAHQPGDPVHFSPDYRWFYRFIYTVLVVAEDCYHMQDCDDPNKMYPDNEKGSASGGEGVSSSTSAGSDAREKQQRKQAAAVRARQARVQAQLNARMAGFGISKLSDKMHQQRGVGIGEQASSSTGRQMQHGKAATTASAASTASTTYLKSLHGLNVGDWEPVQGELQSVFPTNASAVDYKAIVQKYYFP